MTRKEPEDDKKRVSPAWTSVIIAIIVFASGLIMTVRAEDLGAIYAVQKDHEVRIRTIETNIATLVQKESDLLDTMNRYINYQQASRP